VPYHQKGGLGLLCVIACGFILTYIFLGCILAGNVSRRKGILINIGGMVSTFICYFRCVLTNVATADKGLMSFGKYFGLFKRHNLRKKIKLLQLKQKVRKTLT